MNAPRLVLTVGGLGLLRPAPGTWGSLPSVLLALLLVLTTDPAFRWMVDAALVLLGLCAAIGCIRFGAFAEQQWGSKDPPQVVADEVAGQALALLVLPWGPPEDVGRNLLIAGIAFGAFRLFDILKPPPVHQVQRLRGGIGILADDLVAGLDAAILAQLLTRFVL